MAIGLKDLKKPQATSDEKQDRRAQESDKREKDAKEVVRPWESYQKEQGLPQSVRAQNAVAKARKIVARNQKMESALLKKRSEFVAMMEKRQSEKLSLEDYPLEEREADFVAYMKKRRQNLLTQRVNKLFRNE